MRTDSMATEPAPMKALALPSEPLVPVVETLADVLASTSIVCSPETKFGATKLNAFASKVFRISSSSSGLAQIG